VLGQLLDDDVHVRVELLIEQVVGLKVQRARGLGRVSVQWRRRLPGQLPLLLMMPMSLSMLSM